MDAEVIAAIVTSVVSLVIAVGAWLREKTLSEELEKLKSRLAREEAADKAELDYRYDAKRRLYDRFEPLLFEFLDLADFTLERILNLAGGNASAKLHLAEADDQHVGRPPMAQADDEVVATLYGLYAPLVLVRSMRAQLTLVDLSLVERIELQFHLATSIYGSFKDDRKLAALDPRLRMSPSTRPGADSGRSSHPSIGGRV